MTLSPWQIISTQSMMDETIALENLIDLADLPPKKRREIQRSEERRRERV